MLTKKPPSSLDDFMDAAGPGLHRLIVSLIYGYWVAHLAWSRTWSLDSLETRLFDPPGALAVLPRSVVDTILQRWALAVLVIAIAGLCLAVATRRVTGRIVPIAACALLYLHESIVRGYSGHMNHAELPLLTVTLALALIGLPERDDRSEPMLGRFRRSELAVLALTLTIAGNYIATGAARFAKDPLLTFGDELRNYMISHQVAGAGLTADKQIVVPEFVDFLQSVPWWIYAAAFTGATLLEIAAALILRGGVYLYVMPALLLVFHVATMVLVGPYFPESMFLLVVLLLVTWRSSSVGADRGSTTTVTA